MSLSTVCATSAAGRAAHNNGLPISPKEVARAGAEAEGCDTAEEERSYLEPGNVSPNSSYTYKLTVRYRRLPALRLEQPSLITAKAEYYRSTTFTHFKINSNTIVLALMMMINDV